MFKFIVGLFTGACFAVCGAAYFVPQKYFLMLAQDPDFPWIVIQAVFLPWAGILFLGCIAYFPIRDWMAPINKE